MRQRYVAGAWHTTAKKYTVYGYHYSMDLDWIIAPQAADGKDEAGGTLSGHCSESCVLTPAEPQEVEALVALFEAIAREEGWQPGDQLRAYRDHSVYFALHVGGTLVGGLHLVLPDHAAGGLPCQHVWPELGLCKDDGGAAHVAVLALRREFRGKDQGDLFWRLVIALWRHCVLSGVHTLYLEVTPRVLPLYRRLGWPLQVCGPERIHWGEPCLVCSLDVRQVAGALAEKALRSDTYRDILARAVASSTPSRHPDATYHESRGEGMSAVTTRA